VLLVNTLLLYAHPNPHSFNAAIAQVIKEEIEKKGGPLKVKDLYAMNFNPVISQEDFQAFHSGQLPQDIQQEQADVSWADLIIMQGPVWWHSVPAILKGYIDRVFSLGFAYRYTKEGPQGLLKGKKGLLITTSGADQKAAEMSGMLTNLERAVAGVFHFSGFEKYQHHNYFAVTTVSDEARKQMLAELRQLIQNYA
jgi:NAD(P)H dehydrogenase (quinone)